MQIYRDKKFNNPIKVLNIKGRKNVRQALCELEILAKKYYALGFVTYDYETLYFEIFDCCEQYEPSKNTKELGTIIKPKISKEQYISAIEKIKNYIKNGITYEVNYTYPSEVLTNLCSIDLFEALIQKQKTPYNTFMNTPYGELLSFSPELFFKLEGQKITTKPMKGTMPRGNSIAEDNANCDFLANDNKNRAENIMIVDLLRNDLGRIAQVGTVKVDKLFEIEKHPTVFQMTSEISALLKDNINLADIFDSIFPCGSITGAPKCSTMRVIEELEPFSRNIYCGAIGFLSPEEIVFSVPIRILYGSNHKYTYHAGGAIVWDSSAEDEWQETLDKTRFLQTEFSLIETAIDNWQAHVKRLKKSAQELGFKWNSQIETLQLKDKTRVLLHKNGCFDVNTSKIPQKIDSPKIKIKGDVNSANPFLYHKTTIRQNPPEDLFDEIRINERGEITEGIFTNIAIEKNNKLFTPPIKCGLLNGTYREELITNGILKEKILYPKDLINADKIFCFNSVRKMVEVKLCL